MTAPTGRVALLQRGSSAHANGRANSPMTWTWQHAKPGSQSDAGFCSQSRLHLDRHVRRALAGRQRKQRSKGGFATKREASAFLTDQLARLDTGSYVPPSMLTVSAFLTNEWLPAATPTVRSATAATYERAVRLYLVPTVGALRQQGLRGGHLNGLYAELEQAGLSPATIRQVHATIRRACGDAVRWGALTRNPASAADPPKVPRSRVDAWTAN
jgi:hypothetical protein